MPLLSTELTLNKEDLAIERHTISYNRLSIDLDIEDFPTIQMTDLYMKFTVPNESEMEVED